jgi:hypothetical protein
MKYAALSIFAVLALPSCASTDAWLVKKTGLNTAAIITLGLSAKLKGEQLKAEYELLKPLEVTAQK